MEVILVYIGGDLPRSKIPEFIDTHPISSGALNVVTFDGWVERWRTDSGDVSPSHATPIMVPCFSITASQVYFCMGCGLSFIIPAQHLWWAPGYPCEQVLRSEITKIEYDRICVISERCIDMEAVPLYMNSDDSLEVELVQHILRVGKADRYENLKWLVDRHFNAPPQLPAFRVVGG